LLVSLCRIMSTINSQRRVRQRTEEERSVFQAKIMDRNVIAERNVVRADIMVPPLDSIYGTIQTHHWGYLYTCACIVLTRLVRLFYANLEVAQDDERGMVLQSTIDGHIITVDPNVISHFIGVPVLDLPASPYNEVMLPPSMDELIEFFHAVRQGEERPTSIRIGALSPTHHMLAKIVQHNLWPVARRSDLILKKAQFFYAVHLCLLFCLYKHIMAVMLEARDESNTALPFGCLVTQIILQSGININGESKMKIQQPLSKHTLMKSNAQLRTDDSDDEVPILATMPVGFPDMASSSQDSPAFRARDQFFLNHGGLSCYSWRHEHHAAVHHVYTAGGAFHKQAGKAESAGSPGCLKYHHPDSSDDEEDAPMVADD
jgi:hypothetical protein